MLAYQKWELQRVRTKQCVFTYDAGNCDPRVKILSSKALLPEWGS